MKITLSVLSLSFAGVLSSCSSVVSVQPLYTQAEIQKPYLNQRVEGEWIMANLDESHEDAATPAISVSTWPPSAGTALAIA